MTAFLLAIMMATTYSSYDVALVDCYDGDTCTVDILLGMGVVLKDQKVRLCGVNAPEIRPLATREAATKSKNVLLNYMKSASKLQITIPQRTKCSKGACDKKGKYGRWLAYVWADGVNLNQLLVQLGLAEYYLECR